MVPPDFKLDVYERAAEGGKKLEFYGLANDDGSLVCQDLGVLKDRMSDSSYYRY